MFKREQEDDCDALEGEQQPPGEGPALHQDVLNSTIREAMDKLVAEQKLRPAMQPEVTLGDGYEQGKDAELSVSLEVLPQVAVPSLDGIKLDKLVVPVSEAEVDESSGAPGTEIVGSRPGLTPRHSGTIWATYQLAQHWRVGGGINARSSDVPGSVGEGRA